MSDRIRCTCQRCTVRGFMGPAIVITIGVLFLLQQVMRSSYFDFSNTYPVILIIIGAISLASALASDAGHNSSGNPVPPAPPQAAPPAPSEAPSGSFLGQGQ